MLVSVVIPAYNRIKPLGYTLKSLVQAAQAVKIEVLLVDDGSQPALSNLLDFNNFEELKIIAQSNQGSIAARLNGLFHARGKYVLFLDSDDLVHPDKLILQAQKMSEINAQISYCNPARVVLTGQYEELNFENLKSLPGEENPARLLLRVQPPPHCLMYEREYLLRALGKPCVPASRIFDSVGDVWLAYNLAPFSARVVQIDRFLSATGEHLEERYTQHWELLGIDALILVLAFLELTKAQNLRSDLLQLIADCAFISWRKLPRNFNSIFEGKMLEVWQEFRGSGYTELGGRGYQMFARILGPLRAARLLKIFRGQDYSQVATYSRQEIDKLIDTKLEALDDFLKDCRCH